MSDPIIVMLDALSTVGSVPQKSGSGWSCRCPAHDDKRPSLSIGIGEEGRVLLNCHAGCETKAIMTSLGLEMKDLMPRQQSAATPTKSQPLSSEGFASSDEAVAALERTLGPVTKRWLFTDAAGEPVGETLRWDTTTGKTIRPVSKHGDRWQIKAMPDPRPLMHLSELNDLPDGAWVSIVESESCVDAARAIGLVATTSAGGSKAAAKTDWSVLKNKVAIIVPDHDDAGESYAQAVMDLCHQAGADEVRIVRLADHWPDLPASGDLVDVLHLEGGDAEAVHEALDGLAQASTPEPRESESSNNRRTYTPFPVEALPEPIRSYVADGAEAIGCDESFIALPLLSGLAAAVGNTRRIKLKRGWAEPAILWTAVIGESGTQKSPAFRLALKAVRDRQHRLMKEHQAAMKAWEAQHELHEIAMSNWKKAAAKSDKQNDTPPDPPEAPEQPTCPRNWIEDCTTEALAILLQQNPRGLLTLRNELSGWFSFGQYKNGGGADDVARWLQMFDADALIVDRESVNSGIRLSRWFADEALRVYQSLGEEDEDRDRRQLVELIERHDGQVTILQWQRLRSLKRAADAQSELDAIVEAGLGQWDTAPPGPKGGRPTRRFVLSG